MKKEIYVETGWRLNEDGNVEWTEPYDEEENEGMNMVYKRYTEQLKAGETWKRKLTNSDLETLMYAVRIGLQDSIFKDYPHVERNMEILIEAYMEGR